MKRLLILSLFLPQVLFSQDSAMVNEREMDEISSYPLNIADTNLLSFQVFDSLASTKRFIFTGEDHRVERFNTQFELRMMQYLQTKGYQYYLMEAGWVSAWLVNEFVQKGDSAAGVILRNYYSQNYFELFEGLKKTNEKLLENDKIKVIGLDIERDAALALRVLNLWLPQGPVPDSLEMFVESLRILTAIQEEEAKQRKSKETLNQDPFDFGEDEDDDYDYDYTPSKFFYFNLFNGVQELVRIFREKEKDFEVYLGGNYNNFQKAIKEIENSLLWLEYDMKELPQSWVYRELYMETNFKKTFQNKPDAKGFGQFGRCHINRSSKVVDCGFAFFSSLNLRLINNVPEFEDQLASIAIFYTNIGEEESEHNGNINDYFAMTEPGTANLFLDIADHAEIGLTDKFSAIVVVNSNAGYSTYNNDYEFDEANDDTPSNKKKKNEDFSMAYDFNYSLRKYDMQSFNRMTGLNISDQFENYEFGLRLKENRTWLSLHFGFFPEKSTTLFTQTHALNGFHFRYATGYDLIKANWLDLTPELAFASTQFKYTIQDKTARVTPFNNGLFYQFENPSFILDARLNLSIILKFVEFRGFVGYNYDVSNPHWLQNDVKIYTGPTNRWTSLYSGAGISLHIN